MMTSSKKRIIKKLPKKLRDAVNKRYADLADSAGKKFIRMRLWAGRIRRSKSPYPAEAVIFSKDRALQLHGLLCSFYKNVSPRVPIWVLYDCSDKDHAQAYAEVRKIFTAPDIIFTRQQNPQSFRMDLLAILQNLRAPRVFFLVDDLVFTGAVELEKFCCLDPGRYVPSLRMGLNLKRSYTMQQEQPLPTFFEDPAAGDKLICWRWEEGLLDWNYPLSVDGHIFSTGEMRAMISMIDFRAPNTLEHFLQRFRWLFLQRCGIAYRTSKIVNIPCNKVQDENENICGSVHQSVLLGYWQKGLQMDIQSLQGFINEGAHQDIQLKLIPR